MFSSIKHYLNCPTSYYNKNNMFSLINYYFICPTSYYKINNDNILFYNNEFIKSPVFTLCTNYEYDLYDILTNYIDINNINIIYKEPIYNIKDKVINNINKINKKGYINYIYLNTDILDYDDKTITFLNKLYLKKEININYYFDNIIFKWKNDKNNRINFN